MMNNSVDNNIPSSSLRRGILLVAFGSATPVGNTTLAGFENHVRQCFPNTSIRWAFTSANMRSKLAKAKKKIDSVEKALKRMQFEKIINIVVQPLHIIPGIEYENLRNEIEELALKNESRILLGKPLLFNKQSIAKAADALLHHLPAKRQPHEPVICMGHGSWHKGSLGYAAFNKAIASRDPRVYIGTLEGRRTVDNIVKALHKEYPSSPASGLPSNGTPPPDGRNARSPHTEKTVWLLPLLSVIGHHALNDMAGEDAGSWKSILETAGYQCNTVLKGTAEYEKFIAIWTEHIADAMKKF